MDNDKGIPELPCDFLEWADSMMEQAPIFYRIKGHRAMCRCGKCNAEYEVRWTDGSGDYFKDLAVNWDKKPVRFEQTKCKVCGHEGNYEWKRVKSLKVDYGSYWIMQRTTENNAVVRIFKFTKSVQQCKKQELVYKELERYILKNGDPERYKLEYRWMAIEGWRSTFEKKKSITVSYEYCDGRYPGWNDEIEKSNQRYFEPKKLNPYVDNAWNSLQYLIACCNNPAIEMYAKSGMDELVKHLFRGYGKSKLVNRSKDKPEQQLRVSKERLKKLINCHGDIDFLQIFQIEKKNNHIFTEEQIDFLKKNIRHMDQIKRSLNFITITQLMNREKLYSSKVAKNEKTNVLIEYMDYLDMRSLLGYDMNNTVYLFPKNLKRAHNQMVKEKKDRENELYIQEKTKEFPLSSNLVKKLNKKYKWDMDGYSIRPAKSVEEIILEGRTLHHCVGGDNYLRKHTKGITTICFLRMNPEEPYITIEVKGNEIIQWYGENDSKQDKEHVEELLKYWMAAVEEKAAKKKKW